MKKLVLLIAVAGCGDPAVALDGYTLSVDDIAFDHTVGETDCPQDLGDVVVDNTGSEQLVFTISVDDAAGRDLIDFGDGDDLGPTSLDDVEFEVDPGASVTFVPWFNCAQPTSFTTTIHLVPEGGQQVADIPVTATIE